MRQFYRWLLTALLVLGASSKAHAILSDYIFTTGTGAGANMTGATTLWQTSFGGRTLGLSTPVSIGFTFAFDGTNYTQVTVSTSGVMGMGPTAINNNTNNTISGSNVPVLAPLWDGFWMSGGAGGCSRPTINYVTSGSAPNRIFAVRWADIEMAQFVDGSWGTFEVRLYETTNKIEFYYQRISACDVCGRGRGCGSTSSSIGLAVNSGNFLSVSNNGGFTTSSSTPNNGINIGSQTIAANTLLTFTPCTASLAGRIGPGNGGTITMANGDTFFTGLQANVGSSAVFKPFTERMSSPTCPGLCSLSITGAAAADYYFGSPGIQNVTRNLAGLIDTVAITFKPTTTGVRSAVLTVSGPGVARTFNLGADAPFVNYTGIIPQGGTVGMFSGDTLLKGQNVPRHTQQCFTPFMLTNVSSTSRLIDYTLTDPTNQYTISPDTTIGPGASTTPVICFNAIGFGAQPAVLQVNAGGQIRTFILYATSAAPGGELRIQAGNATIDSTTQLYRTDDVCTGEAAVTIPLNMVNTGFNNFSITSVEFYRVDTTYGQGKPSYPFLRDSRGALVPSRDYIITTSPGIAPLSKNVVTLPISVAQGQVQTVYITFVPQSVGKRFARAVIRTNGQASSGRDTNGVLTEGIIGFDLYARGVGASLSDKLGGALPSAIVFPETHINTTVQQWMYIVNNGYCPLRVNAGLMQLMSGDVDEFEIVQRPTVGDPNTKDAIILPGGKDSLLVRFKPSQLGSRRASIRFVTNDSTIYIPGVTARGEYLLDVFGTGKADLYAEGADLGQALIGGDTSEYRHATVRFKNTRGVPVTIDSLSIEGPDAAEFKRDASKPAWPAKGTILNSGQEKLLWVAFAPAAGGVVGTRNAFVRLYTTTKDTAAAPITGLAGTRTISVTPPAIDFGQLSSSTISRRTITITNSGTMPLSILQPVIPPGNDELKLGQFPRLTLVPGQIEYLEVSYVSATPISVTAALDIKSNATNGTQQVQLHAITVRTKGKDDPPTVTTPASGGVQEWEFTGLSADAISGEAVVRDASGMMLMQSVPNPGRDQVEIGYVMPVQASMTLVLYDAQGRLVREIESGIRNAGEHRIRVDVSGLPSGSYRYHLMSDGHSLSQPMVIVR